MIVVTSVEAQSRFGELIDRAQREPIEITRRGRPVAYVVSEHDLSAKGACKRGRAQFHPPSLPSVIAAGKPASLAGKATAQQKPKLSRLLPARPPWPGSRLPGRDDGGESSRDEGGVARDDGGTAWDDGAMG